MIKKNGNNLNSLLKDLKQKRNKKKAKILSRFFKTGSGQYGEGDKFLGITVPESRKIAQKYGNLALPIISKLLKNKYHEVRLIALLVLVHKYKLSPRSDLGEIKKRKIVDFYLKNTKYINNWDLVDLSAHYIVGDYLYQTTVLKKAFTKIVLKNLTELNLNILLKLAKSSSLWERRIAIISTLAFIYKGESKWTFKIVKMLIKDKHDLIHKACGWMLREVGKKVSETELTLFLDAYGPQMPRIMLRYAIERLPENKRLYYLKLNK